MTLPDLSQVERLHRAAMNAADEALLAKINADSATAQQKQWEAYRLERDAAKALEQHTFLQPTRAILYRSAATLALECGALDEAAQLASSGLDGIVAPEIRDELNSIVAESEHRARASSMDSLRPPEVSDVGGARPELKTAQDEVSSVTNPLAREAHLVMLARQGSAEAFGELIQGHRNLCLKRAMLMIRNRSDAEDEVQNAFWKAFQRLDQFRGEGSFAAWLNRIVENQCLMRIREERNSRFVYLDEGSAGSEDQLPPAELASLIRKEITGIPPLLRHVMMLRDVEQLPMADVASRLALSVPAAKSRLMRARAELRSRISKHSGLKGAGTLIQMARYSQAAYSRADASSRPSLESRSVAERSVLVVDEEALPRVSISQTLRGRGLSVLEAEDAEVAVRLVRARRERIGVAVLNTALPLPSQCEVVEELNSASLDTRIILANSLDFRSLSPNSQKPGQHYNEPQDVNELISMVCSAMALNPRRASD